MIIVTRSQAYRMQYIYATYNALVFLFLSCPLVVPKTLSKAFSACHSRLRLSHSWVRQKV